jgi:hypothetical protein
MEKPEPFHGSIKALGQSTSLAISKLDLVMKALTLPPPFLFPALPLKRAANTSFLMFFAYVS